MEVDPDNHEVSFDQPLGADFAPVKLVYSHVADPESAKFFGATLQNEVQAACDKKICGAIVQLATSESMLDERIRRHFSNDIRWLNGSIIQCETDDCPLRGPSTGDREPRNPAPELPTLYAEEPLPAK